MNNFYYIFNKFLPFFSVKTICIILLEVILFELDRTTRMTKLFLLNFNEDVYLSLKFGTFNQVKIAIAN